MPETRRAKRRGAQAREKNPQWKGGRTVASNGYVLIKVDAGHHLADVRNYAYEHRLIAEKKLGRRLRKDEQIHHVDGDRQNNHPDNLAILTFSEHRAEHRTARGQRLRLPGAPNPTIACACGCGATFPKYDATNRPRRFVPGHNLHPRVT